MDRAAPKHNKEAALRAQRREIVRLFAEIRALRGHLVGTEKGSQEREEIMATLAKRQVEVLRLRANTPRRRRPEDPDTVLPTFIPMTRFLRLINEVKAEMEHRYGNVLSVIVHERGGPHRDVVYTTLGRANENGLYDNPRRKTIKVETADSILTALELGHRLNELLEEETEWT